MCVEADRRCVNAADRDCARKIYLWSVGMCNRRCLILCGDGEGCVLAETALLASDKKAGNLQTEQAHHLSSAVSDW